MAKKKRSKASYSKASKKGWAKLTKKEREARVKKAAEARKLSAFARKVDSAIAYDKAARELSKQFRPPKATLAEIDRLKKEAKESHEKTKEALGAYRKILEKLGEEKKEVERKIHDAIFKDFVPPDDAAWLRRDGTLAKTMSRLRHIPEADKVWKKLDRVKDSPADFRYWAEIAADVYDIDVGEVYDFYFSP